MARQRTTVSEILDEEFLAPMDITREELAQRMGISSKHLNEAIRNGEPAIFNKLAETFSTTTSFWVNIYENSRTN